MSSHIEEKLNLQELEQRRLRRLQEKEERDNAKGQSFEGLRRGAGIVGSIVTDGVKYPFRQIRYLRHKEEIDYINHTKQAPVTGPPSSIRHKDGTLEVRVGQKYKLLSKVGAGNFGQVFRGENTDTGESVAVKLERRREGHKPLLLYESRLYNILNEPANTHRIPGIPKIHWYGVEGQYNVLVLQSLGQSLEDLFSFCGRQFSLKTTLMIAEQCLTRLEYVHSKYFIHRDIKPENILVGQESSNHSQELFIIDFGLAKKYKDPKTNKHRPLSSGRVLVGTARYVSINTHLGLEQSRRDDLEALGHALIYFLKGQLPWQQLVADSDEEKHEMIKNIKMDTSVDALCSGLPEEFAKYMQYVRDLRYDENPDYNYLRRLFREVMHKYNLPVDQQFDWDIVHQELTLAHQVNESDSE